MKNNYQEMGVDEMAKTEVDLQKFCCKDPMWFEKMGRPFIQGEKTWATNGWVAIGVPPRPDVLPNEYAPDVLNIHPKEQPSVWFDLPSFDGEPCKRCDGKINEIECFECEGDGIVTLKNEISTYFGIECNSCDGSGHIAFCPHCYGTGYEPTPYVKIGPAQFTPGAIHLIRELPGIQIAPTGERTVALLKFDGGMGYIMPANPSVPTSRARG